MCASVLDEDGAPLYTADSITWRLVSGEATLLTGVFGIAEPPITGRCIVVESTSEEPIVVEATFLGFATEAAVELPEPPTPRPPREPRAATCAPWGEKPAQRRA